MIDVKEPLKADDKALLKDIMVKNVISLKKEAHSARLRPCSPGTTFGRCP